MNKKVRLFKLSRYNVMEDEFQEKFIFAYDEDDAFTVLIGYDSKQMRQGVKKDYQVEEIPVKRGIQF